MYMHTYIHNCSNRKQIIYQCVYFKIKKWDTQCTLYTFKMWMWQKILILLSSHFLWIKCWIKKLRIGLCYVSIHIHQIESSSFRWAPKNLYLSMLIKQLGKELPVVHFYFSTTLILNAVQLEFSTLPAITK